MYCVDLSENALSSSFGIVYFLISTLNPLFTRVSFSIGGGPPKHPPSPPKRKKERRKEGKERERGREREVASGGGEQFFFALQCK